MTVPKTRRFFLGALTAAVGRPRVGRKRQGQRRHRRHSGGRGTQSPRHQYSHLAGGARCRSLRRQSGRARNARRRPLAKNGLGEGQGIRGYAADVRRSRAWRRFRSRLRITGTRWPLSGPPPPVRTSIAKSRRHTTYTKAADDWSAAANKRSCKSVRSIGACRIRFENRTAPRGIIGNVYISKGLCYKRRPSIGHEPDSPAPPGVDSDLWLGPAPLRPFN